MSPPIRTPDGNEVSEIVLPDGSTASEVIGPDGNVVFEAGPDIPDSAVYQWLVDEGTGQTLTDEINGTEITLSNSNWVTGSQYQRGAALDFDGYSGMTTTSLPEIGVNQTFSVEVWVEPQSLGVDDKAEIVYQQPSESNRFAIGFDNAGNGTIAGQLFDGTNRIGKSSSDITLNDGLKQIIYTFDSGTDDGTIYVNTVAGSGTNDPQLPSGSDDAFYFGGTFSGFDWDGIGDLLVVYDDVLSQSQIDSRYQAHPST